jgi:hypothetical protein
VADVTGPAMLKRRQSGPRTTPVSEVSERVPADAIASWVVVFPRAPCRARSQLVFAGIWALMQGITDIVRAFQIRALKDLPPTG